MASLGFSWFVCFFPLKQRCCFWGQTFCGDVEPQLHGEGWGEGRVPWSFQATALMLGKRNQQLHIGWASLGMEMGPGPALCHAPWKEFVFLLINWHFPSCARLLAVLAWGWLRGMLRERGGVSSGWRGGGT